MKIFQGLCEQRIKIVLTFAAEIKRKQTVFMFIGFKNITTVQLNNNQQQNNQNQNNNQVPMVIPFDRSGM